jgi:hypothetical protein
VQGSSLIQILLRKITLLSNRLGVVVNRSRHSLARLHPLVAVGSLLVMPLLLVLHLGESKIKKLKF